MSQQPNEIPDRIRKLRRNSLVLYRSWWTTHYMIGTVGVLAGALAAGAAGASALQQLKPWTWLFGAIAALSTSLVTFLGPLQRAERYWKAFHFIDQTCFEYESSLIDLQTFSQRAKDARLLMVGSAATRDNDTKLSVVSPM